MENKNKILVFDFDGTLVESSQNIIKALSNYIPGLTFEKYKFLMHKYFLHPSFFNIFQIFWLELKVKSKRNEIHQKVQEEVSRVDFVPGLIDVLKELKLRNYKLIILSSNYKDSIEKYLKSKKITIFDEIYGSGHVLSKFIELKRIKKHNPNSEIFYIGDELRDIYTARKAKVKEVGVTWGINSREDFEEYKTQKILEGVEQLLEI
jgi:phosphoglycolate phosphatase